MAAMHVRAIYLVFKQNLNDFKHALLKRFFF